MMIKMWNKQNHKINLLGNNSSNCFLIRPVYALSQCCACITKCDYWSRGDYPRIFFRDSMLNDHRKYVNMPMNICSVPSRTVCWTILQHPYWTQGWMWSNTVVGKIRQTTRTLLACLAETYVEASYSKHIMISCTEDTLGCIMLKRLITNNGLILGWAISYVMEI